MADQIKLAEARGRAEAYGAVRAALRQELRGAPHNAPPQSQLTYVGGLARARRMVERMFREALAEEVQLVLGLASRTASTKPGGAS